MSVNGTPTYLNLTAVPRDEWTYVPGTNQNVQYSPGVGSVTSNVANPTPPIEWGRDLTP